jgi:L-threonylcarbamoyladenylate synthase
VADGSDLRAAAVVAVLRSGGLAVFPTDTVYGLVCAARDEAATERLYDLKGRAAMQPIAVVAASVGTALELVRDLDALLVAVVEALLPGAFTLVLPNPERRFPWLNRTRPDTLGLRVPSLSGPAATVLSEVGAIAATSANLPGGPDPRRLEDVPAAILAGVGAALDGGHLPGIASTVVDLTGEEPVILREGAVAAAETLARIADATR